MENLRQTSGSQAGPTQASARANWIAFSAALLAAAALMGATAALKVLALSAPWRLLIALLPVPVYAFFLTTQVRAVGRLDELQQRIQLEGLVIAFPTTFMAILTTWLLHTAGFLPGMDLSDAIVFFLLFMIFIHVASRWLAQRRYR
ncbi:MAG: hypothetical protein GWN58_04655 [Anaerolineae bacterium]|nr:hypothetical protein [Anaerolineae bacterium]